MHDGSHFLLLLSFYNVRGDVINVPIGKRLCTVAVVRCPAVDANAVLVQKRDVLFGEAGLQNVQIQRVMTELFDQRFVHLAGQRNCSVSLSDSARRFTIFS